MIISITYNDTFATVTAVAVILGSLFLPKYNSGASIPHWPWSKSPYIYLPSLFSGGAEEAHQNNFEFYDIVRQF